MSKTTHKPLRLLQARLGKLKKYIIYSFVEQCTGPRSHLGLDILDFLQDTHGCASGTKPSGLEQARQSVCGVCVLILYVSLCLCVCLCVCLSACVSACICVDVWMWLWLNSGTPRPAFSRGSAEFKLWCSVTLNPPRALALLRCRHFFPPLVKMQALCSFDLIQTFAVHVGARLAACGGPWH
jgi:hypothetical protein